MSYQYQPTRSSPPPPSQHQPSEDRDVRVGLIKSIWGCSTGMLAICIPLVGALGHGPPGPGGNGLAVLLPMCVIAGATIATLAVSFGMRSSASGLGAPSGSNADLQEHIRQIEERLANVETISSFERGLMEREAQAGLHSQSHPPLEHGPLSAKSPSPTQLSQ